VWPVILFAASWTPRTRNGLKGSRSSKDFATHCSGMQLVSLGSNGNRKWKSAKPHTPSYLSKAKNCSYAICVANFLTASESISRVTPLMIMLIPTSVPIAHTELEGQCT